MISMMFVSLFVRKVEKKNFISNPPKSTNSTPKSQTACPPFMWDMPIKQSNLQKPQSCTTSLINPLHPLPFVGKHLKPVDPDSVELPTLNHKKKTHRTLAIQRWQDLSCLCKVSGTPQKSNIETKPSFWVSMLVFGSVRQNGWLALIEWWSEEFGAALSVGPGSSYTKMGWNGAPIIFQWPKIQ